MVVKSNNTFRKRGVNGLVLQNECIGDRGPTMLIGICVYPRPTGHQASFCRATNSSPPGLAGGTWINLITDSRGIVVQGAVCAAALKQSKVWR